MTHRLFSRSRLGTLPVAAAMVLLLTVSLAHAGGSILVEPKLARVVATGLTPGGEAMFFGVGRELGESTPQLLGFRTTRATDSTGKARFLLNTDVPRRSVWLVVDLDQASGWPAYSIAGPPINQGGLPIDEQPFDKQAILQDGNGFWTQIAVASTRAMVAIARPGEGGWYCSAVDGAPKDHDTGTDGGILLELADCEPIGNGPKAPDYLDGGDVVAIFDPATLAFSAARIDWR